MSAFTITVEGTGYSKTRYAAQKQWEEACKEQGMIFKNFDADPENKWIGTMSTYLNFFGALPLELMIYKLGIISCQKPEKMGTLRGSLLLSTV